MSEPAPESSVVTVARIGPGAVEALRARVLRAGTGLDALRYEQDADPRTATFAAVLGPDPDVPPVGTATVFPEACRWAPSEAGAWRLRAMATEDGLRGRGVGAAVLRAAVDHVAAEGGCLVWCDARVAARAFYERHGFAVEGEGYEVEGIGPHWPMARRLTR